MATPPTDGDPRCLPFLAFTTQINVIQEQITGDQAQVPAECAQLNRLFQSQVQAMDWEDWPVQRRSLLQSIRVEMHKQLRLLVTDLMFLKAAKQAATLEQRWRDIGDRLTNLQGYCDAIIQLSEEKATGEQSYPPEHP